jgi:two-component system cell cycle sensor histidine kinase/response regulator CckA
MLSHRRTSWVAPEPDSQEASSAATGLARGPLRGLAVLCALGFYAALFTAAHPALGAATGMLATFFVIVAGWAGGARVGLAVGLSATWFNALLAFTVFGSDTVGLQVRLLGSCILGFVGWTVGRLRDTRVALEHELELKQRLARELTRASEQLESKVEERTQALARANASLKAEVAERKDAQEAQVRLTEQRIALEQQLLRAQKMEAMGRLAGGVAHDFNNLLTAIIGFAELAASQSGETQRSAIAQIGNAAARASELTRALLAFARQQPVPTTVVDVNDVVSSAERLLERLIGEDVRLELELDEDTSPIVIDPTRLEQVIMNLAVNARDAMPSGGTLVIATENVSSEDGEFVRISVTDSGTGMDEATRARLFEPFFTTKGPGQGTGLGLATSYGIVTQAGGRIGVSSQLGKGSTFLVDLPRAEGRAVREAESKISSTILRGRERVLVVEDEPLVRAIMEITLVDQGFEVVCAETPARALEITRALRRLDAVIADVILPGQNGHELVQAIRELVPDVAVLYVSGYAPETISARGVLTGDGSFLEKPFAPGRLVEKLAEALERRKRRAGHGAALKVGS